MTEEKQKTPEELAQEAEIARATNVKKTLESKLIQGAVGSNIILSNQSLYGSLGVDSARTGYDASMSSDEAKKMKDSVHQAQADEYRKKGIFESPAYPSNGDLSYRLKVQLSEVMMISKLNELEKAVKEVGADLGDFKLPEKLKEYSYVKLIEKAKELQPGSERIDISKLPEDEQNAFAAYQLLSQAYERACALKASRANAYADIKTGLKEISDFYTPKEENQAA